MLESINQSINQSIGPGEARDGLSDSSSLYRKEGERARDAIIINRLDALLFCQSNQTYIYILYYSTVCVLEAIDFVVRVPPSDAAAN
jgi:hypothetical protein